jgi:hypothetical protein
MKLPQRYLFMPAHQENHDYAGDYAAVYGKAAVAYGQNVAGILDIIIQLEEHVI